MHITILALGSQGDILPYAALGRGLIEAGHQVRFVTFSSFAEVIADFQMDFYPIQGDARSLVLNAGPQMLSLIRSFSSLADGYAQDLSSPILGETDLLINQLPAGLYGYDLAERYGFQMILASVIPLTSTRFSPLIGFPAIPWSTYNQLTYKIGEQMAWQMFRRTINHWRTNTLKLAPLPLLGYFNKLRSMNYPVLNGFSPHVVAPPTDWSENIHTTGYWFPEDRHWRPPTDLIEFIEGDSPPIFIGFGSMPVEEPLRTTNLIVEALKTTGQRGIIHSGWSKLGTSQLPTTLKRIDYAPYHWLFPRLSLLVHHGGSGTTGLGLRSGVPSLILPFLFDQFYWGRCIGDLKVGPQSVPFKHLSVEKLSKAIRFGLEDPHCRQNAARLGRLIRSENGIAEAIRVIENSSRPTSASD